MLEEYRKGSTWRRIGILLAILVALILGPALVSSLLDPFTEAPLPPNVDFVELPGPPRFRLMDYDDDGRVDCALRIPALRWARLGFRREGAGRCDGPRVEPMPAEMAELADEALRLRDEHDFSTARLLDTDDDGRVDCVSYDGTWRYVAGAVCPDRHRSDAAPLSDTGRAAANRLLVVEREIRQRWIDPLLDD